MGVIKAVIFDLDGVIVDTAKYHYLAWKKLAGELGFEFSAEHNERLKGVSRMRSLEIVLEVGGIEISDSRKLELADKKNQWYLDYINKITPEELLPDVIKLLNWLRGKKIKAGLGSASRNTMRILERLKISELFDAIVDGNLVASAKPDPEVFIECAGRLGVEPEFCVVFEDAVAGVQAAKNAGMIAVGIGNSKTLIQADVVITDFTHLNYDLISGEKSSAGYLLEEAGDDKDLPELNGTRFFTGNGYMGYRGTLEEDGSDKLVANTLAGLYDKVGDAWREPVNAPNGLHTTFLFNDSRPGSDILNKASHLQRLDIRQGLHSRRTVYVCHGKEIIITAERFVSIENVHLIVMKYTVTCGESGKLVIRTGIDGNVWDINGPHLKTIDLKTESGQLIASCMTTEGASVCVGEWVGPLEGTEWKSLVVIDGKSIYREITISAEQGKEYGFYKTVSVFTSNDGMIDTAGAAIENNRRAGMAGYFNLRLRHGQLWQERWLLSDIEIDGDDRAQFFLRYSIYLLLSAAPEHSDNISIPARGLSGQTYKGAIFWDTEIFMMPFFNFNFPSIAKNIIKYRCRTLNGAIKKASEYGYRGAYYAWESQETGDDACTYFNVNDVFSGRPMRTYFRDKQIHISADVAYSIWQYYISTGDDSIFYEGGAEVVLETARFYYSWAYFKKDKDRYEILDVTGPDEYHERVSNNAFTNIMIRHNLEIAIKILDIIKHGNPGYYNELIKKMDFEKDIEPLREMYNKLYIPSPRKQDGLVEQFDGYFKLEDVPLDDLKKRIKIRDEYLGGGNGLAVTTQIIKQADVAVMLHLFSDFFSQDVKKANWDYYEKRTEHGSTLGASIYSLLACKTGEPEKAYPFFMKTASLDITGDYKRYVGDLYIGGTHQAANGGAWMSAVLGFAGLSFGEGYVRVEPALPEKWERISFGFRFRGQSYFIEINKKKIILKGSGENTAPVIFKSGVKSIECLPGNTVEFD